MAFHLNGYSNFHDDNQDWIASKIKSIEDTEAHTEELAKAAQASADASQASAEASQASADASQASTEAAQQSAENAAESETNAAASELSAKNYADHIADPVAGLVTDWLKDNITPTTPAIDASLTVSGAGADAKVTGDKIRTINSGYYAYDIIKDSYISRDNGSVLSETGSDATDFIPFPPYSRLVLVSSDLLVWGALYDSEKQYIDSFSAQPGTTERLNLDGEMKYFRISGKAALIANFKYKIFEEVDPTLTKRYNAADAYETGTRLRNIKTELNNMKESVPVYYVQQLTTKEATVRNHFNDTSVNGDSLVFITDTHFASDLFTSNSPTSNFNANNSFSLINDIIKKCSINKIIFGGDLVNSATDVNTMLLCMSAFRAKWNDYNFNLRYCVGNHEYFTGADFGVTVKPTPAELYAAGIKYTEPIIKALGDMDTYYFDNELQKIRYFVISCGRDTETTMAQREWVFEQFENIPDDYNVICIGHGFLSDNMQAFRGGYKPFADALDAIKAHETYTYNGNTYDYSSLNNVTVVCMITGHTHIDGYLLSTGGIPCICTTSDSYALNYELVDNTPTLTPRTKGTTDEQAFDVFQFDFTNRKIYTTRIGYGSDREFTY